MVEEQEVEVAPFACEARPSLSARAKPAPVAIPNDPLRLLGLFTV